jgi:hypothetical protein
MSVAHVLLGRARYVRHESERPMRIVWRLDEPMPPDWGGRCPSPPLGNRDSSVQLPVALDVLRADLDTTPPGHDVALGLHVDSSILCLCFFECVTGVPARSSL